MHGLHQCACTRLHPCIMRAAGECQQWDSHAWFKIYTCVCTYICVCRMHFVRVCMRVCPLSRRYPNLERKCIFEQRTLTRWPAQVNLCVCNSEKCVCVTLGDKVNGVFFSDATEPVWIHEPGVEMDFIFLACVRELKRNVARNLRSFHNIVWKGFCLLCKHESYRNK